MFVIALIESQSSYLIVHLHFPSELLLYFFCADIVSVLLQYIAVFRSKVPALRYA